MDLDVNIAALKTAAAKGSDGQAKASRAEAKAAAAAVQTAVAAVFTVAKVSDSEDEIAFLKLTDEKIRHELFGTHTEGKQRMLDQFELQLDLIEANATQDELAAEEAAAETTQITVFARCWPVRKPLPAHLPRERVVVHAPISCACSGSDKL